MIGTNGQRLFEACDGFVGIAGVPVRRAKIGAHIRVVRLNSEGLFVVLDCLRISLTVVIQVAQLGQRVEVVGIGFQLRRASARPPWLTSLAKLACCC